MCVCVCVCDLYKCILVATDGLCKALGASERRGTLQILIIILIIIIVINRSTLPLKSELVGAQPCWSTL